MTASPRRALARRIHREILRRSFHDFAAAAWPIVEPTRARLPSLAFDASCAVVQASHDGRLTRCAASQPCGTGKSLVFAVLAPAWLLLVTDGQARIMVGSYSYTYAERDSRRCRELLASEWYRTLVAGRWTIKTTAADTVADYSTTTGGRRLIVSVGGKALGERCTHQIIDEALSGASIHSAADKREAARFVNEILPSRCEDPERNPRLLVGQRLCIDDPVSVVAAQNWPLLTVPAMLGESDTPCVLLDDAGREVWRDPRTPGDGVPVVSLLGVDALERLKLELGSQAFNAMYLQKVSDDSTALLRRSWWNWYRPLHASASAPRPAGCNDAPAVEQPEHFERVTIAADLTFGSTTATADYASIQAWGARGSGRYLIDHHHAREGFEASCSALETMAAKFPGCRVVIEKAANGSAVIETLRQKIPGVLALRPQGPKLARVAAIAPTAESGCLFLPLGWHGAELFVEECAGGSKHDDIPDATAMAVSDLNAQAAHTEDLSVVGGWTGTRHHAVVDPLRPLHEHGGSGSGSHSPLKGRP